MLEITQRLTDEQLCQEMARRGDSPEAFARATDAFNELYSRYARWLFSYLVSRVRRSDLEDVAQVVWHRVWERIETGFHGGKFQVWMFFIARNYLIDLSRRAQTDRLGDLEQSLSDFRSARPDEVIEQQEQWQILQNGLSRMGSQARDVMTRRLGGEGYDTICDQMGIPRSKAYKLLQQARQFLAQWLSISAQAALV